MKSTKVCVFLSVNRGEQSFVAKDVSMHDIRGNTSKEFTLVSSHREVGVIHNQGMGLRTFDGITSHGNTAQEPAVEAVPVCRLLMSTLERNL